MHNQLLKISLYAFSFYIFFLPFNSIMARLLAYFMMICFMLYPVFKAIKFKKLIKIDKIILCYIFIFMLSIIISIDKFSVKNLERHVISIVSFLFFYWSLALKKDNTKELGLEDIYMVNYILCFNYILFAFGPFNFKYILVEDKSLIRTFTMGLGNPNATSVYVMFSIVVLLIQSCFLKKKISKMINILLIVTLIYILIKLSSRTVVFCTLIIVTYRIISINKKIWKLFSYFFMSIPVLMIPIQFFLANQKSEIKILGKSLDTGRSDLYKEVYESVKEFPLSLIFGNFFKFPLRNMHNAPLVIFATLGIIGLVFYTIFWFREINILNKTINTKIRRIAYVSILVFFIHSSSEAMVMIGTIPYGILMLIIVKIARGDFKY